MSAPVAGRRKRIISLAWNTVVGHQLCGAVVRSGPKTQTLCLGTTYAVLPGRGDDLIGLCAEHYREATRR